MPEAEHRHGLFPALLKHWRRQRGLSQLDLALAADVSSRHISFLETGRSTPTPQMVLVLATALGVPLRQANAMLRAAGHEPAYREGPGDIPDAVARALQLCKDHHEPYPVLVVDRTYAVLDHNRAAGVLLTALVGVDPGATAPMNLAVLTFDPAGARPHLVNFADVGRQLLWRIQREVLADPSDGELGALLDTLLEMPTIDPAWRRADLSVPSEPALVLHLRAQGLDLRFLTMITAFQAPQNVAVEQLRIETWYPYDQATADACRQLAPPEGG